MNSEYSTLDERLLELNRKCELLKESRNESLLFRNECICRNASSERKLQRLLAEKEQLISLREMLLKDYFKNSIRAGQNKLLLSHRVEEFKQKSETTKLKLQNLPSVSQIHESIQFNEKLTSEHLQLNKMLGNVKIDYSKIIHYAKADFMEKVIEFSSEFFLMRKCKDNKKRHNCSFVIY